MSEEGSLQVFDEVDPSHTIYFQISWHLDPLLDLAIKGLTLDDHAQSPCEEGRGFMVNPSLTVRISSSNSKTEGLRRASF